MTSNIIIGKYTVKPSAVKWRSSVLAIVETCVITLPRITYLKNDMEQTPVKGKQSPRVVFAEGDKVSVSLGYDNKNEVRFTGFVKRINQADTLELECEGYSYQLPKAFSKSYQSTTVRDILTDIIADTDIKIAEQTMSVAVKNVRFKNATGLQVLEWMQKELHLSVYFNFDSIYVGTLFGWKKQEVKLQLGWNTADDKAFKQRKADTDVVIKLVEKDATGETKKVKADVTKYTSTKEIKIKAGLDKDILAKIVNDLQSRENYRGYEGQIAAFLEPKIEKSDVVKITDNRFPEREGLFFVETVDGSFSSSGGRQVITLNYFANGN